jgi:hypothetical protein
MRHSILNPLFVTAASLFSMSTVASAQRPPPPGYCGSGNVCQIKDDFVESKLGNFNLCSSSDGDLFANASTTHGNGGGQPVTTPFASFSYFTFNWCTFQFTFAEAFGPLNGSVTAGKSSATVNGSIANAFLQTCSLSGCSFSTGTANLSVSVIGDGFSQSDNEHQRTVFPDGTRIDRRQVDTSQEGTPSGTVSVGATQVSFNNGFGDFGTINSGTVTMTPAPACSGNGSSCKDNTDCCSGTCGGGLCCNGSGAPCMSGSDCCSGVCNPGLRGGGVCQ